MRILDLLTLEEQLLVSYMGTSTLLEASGPVVVEKGSLWDETFADKMRRYADLSDKVNRFIDFKTANPLQGYGASDTHMQKKAIIANKAGIPGLRHAHISRDVSIYYTLEGSNPIRIKLLGVFDHKETGTGDNAQTKKQQSLAKRLKNS